MIRGSKVENNKSIEIFGNSDLPSRSGTFVSAETFKECLKKDSPILITVDGEEVGHIVMRNATAEENEGVNNYIKSISEPLYTRDEIIKAMEKIRTEGFDNHINNNSDPLYTKNDMIKRLEKVKEEMHDMLESDVVQGDHWCTLIKNKAHLFISVVEKNIDELKG